MVKTINQMKQAIEDKSCQIVDARGAGRFAGKDPEPRPGVAGGHMPGAFNLPFTELLQKDDYTKFKSKEEIGKIFQEAGIDLSSSDPIITTCGSGVTACTLSFAMSLCGRDIADSPVYDGSWAEYSRSDLEVETGAL